MSLADLSPAQKDELVVSLSALLLHDNKADLSADNLNAVIKASGNKVAAFWPTLFASYLEKSEGVSKFLGPPAGAGGGGAAPAAGAGAAAPAKVEEKKAEEEEVDLGAGNMFGGGGDGY